MSAHNHDDVEVWIVYDSGDFVAVLNNEEDAKGMCSMLGEWHTYKRFAEVPAESE